MVSGVVRENEVMMGDINRREFMVKTAGVYQRKQSRKNIYFVLYTKDDFFNCRKPGKIEEERRFSHYPLFFKDSLFFFASFFRLLSSGHSSSSE